VEQNANGIKRLFRSQLAAGDSSHVAPETPGSIHREGTGLLAGAWPTARPFASSRCCLRVDGEAETGPLAASWHSNKFLNPATDGAVLPILHLNGYKIANPTVLARIPHAELEELMRGYGYEPFTLEGHDPETMHQQMAVVLDTMLDRNRAIQKAAREEGPERVRPAARWPMLISRAKGWTGEDC